jgi:hypothetical protein
MKPSAPSEIFNLQLGYRAVFEESVECLARGKSPPSGAVAFSEDENQANSGEGSTWIEGK